MMEHIKDIDITTFRGVRSLQLRDLMPINILTGDNNCGKTSVLEILESFEDPGDFASWRTLLRREDGPVGMVGYSYYEAFYDLFDVNLEESEKKIEYTIRTAGDESFQIVLTALEDTEILTDDEY